MTARLGKLKACSHKEWIEEVKQKADSDRAK